MNAVRWNQTRAVLLVLLAALLPSMSHAQEKQPMGEKAPNEPRRSSIVTLGTTKEKVDSLLGTPRTGWIINCLCRSMYTYPDGTQVIFVDGRVVSLLPNGLAEGSPDKGFTVERDGRQVLFEPLILRGVPMDGPLGALKHDVEECFYFAPSFAVIAPRPPPYFVPNYISLRRILAEIHQP